MLKINNMRVRIGAIFLLFAFPFLRVSGQEVNQSLGGGASSFKDRIAIRTNVVDWVLTTPNIAFDYDLVNTPYDKKSIGLGLKYNWNTSHTYIPKQVYNLFDARFDYRFYWRQQSFDNRENFYGDWEREWIKSTKGLGKLRARANCFRAAENPKSHISFFVGPYLSFSSFSIKLSGADDALGRQGMAFGAGLTGGIALPLYGYENGSALDLEFGGSIGWHFASYDFFAADVEHNEYPKQGHRSGFVFYPLVTDARVSLVYRFRSISKQHTAVDYDLIDRRYMARLMELDRGVTEVYNDSIKVFKNALDERNEEIALYKQTVESDTSFNKAFSLEYLTPYMYMLDAPKQYTRHNKDTLPKIHIDSIEQITDPIMLSVREDIDSIPHVTSEQIDMEFVNQYNNISDADGKKVNRTALIRNIYTRLNTYIEDNNSKLVAGTFGAETRSEKLNKYNPKQQGRSQVEVTYKDSIRTVEMTENEKIEWLNSIKRKAWSDIQKRMQGEYPGRVEIPVMQLDSVAVDSVVTDSVATDSMMVDSVMSDSLLVGAVLADSLVVDSLVVDSLITDSFMVDSLVTDSLQRVILSDEAEATGKKAKAKRKKAEAKAAKAEKSKKRASKTKGSQEIVDSIKVDSLVTESVSVAVALVDTAAAVAADVVEQQDALTDELEMVDKKAKAKRKKAEAKASKVSKTAKSAKSKKRTDKTKRSQEVVDSVKVDSITVDSIMADSISVEVALLGQIPVDTLAEISIGHVETEPYVWRNRDFFIKEDDED